jgi:type I restriction enzyme S subunit
MTSYIFPQNWTQTTLLEIARINPPLPNELLDATEVTFLPMKRVEEKTGKIDLSEIRNYREVKKGFTKFINGDIILAKITPCMENGKIAIVNNLKNGIGFGSTEFHVIRFHPSINRDFYFYFLLQENIRDYFASKMTGTVGQKRVPSQILEELEIPLPPLTEQSRIVDKLVVLFGRLDKSIQQIEKARIQLKIYRKSILGDAFSGKLTKNSRITTLTNSKVTNENVNSTYFQIPNEWKWVQSRDVCIKIQDGSHFSPKQQYSERNSNRYLYITAKNIKENGLDLSDVTYVDSDFHNSIYSRCNPEKGDILYIKDGVTTGIATINTLDEPFSLLSSVAIFKTNIKLLNNTFLKYYLNSPMCYNMMTKKMTGTAIKRIILQRLKTFNIPLPSLQEQMEIVNILDYNFSILNVTEQELISMLRKSKEMHRSILKYAFEGKLVPQDFKEEDAHISLGRIKKEKSDLVQRGSYSQRRLMK